MNTQKLAAYFLIEWDLSIPENLTYELEKFLFSVFECGDFTEKLLLRVRDDVHDIVDSAENNGFWFWENQTSEITTAGSLQFREWGYSLFLKKDKDGNVTLIHEYEAIR